MLRGIIAAAMLAAAAAAPAQEAPAPAPDYAQDGAWLCLPGRTDACGQPLATAALNSNGYGSNGSVRPAENPAIDCFYVYPTVSRDETVNSDLTPGLEEQATAAVQFARFGSVCRTFAPLYRQVTVPALRRAFAGEDLTANSNLAYEDVRAAFRQFLEGRNQDRPYVLIGHSQGTIHLSRLLAEIEGTPAAERMLSALLIGYNVEVPQGQVVGGTFRETPLCTRPGQTGCVISYVSFRATNPPPQGALFGRTARPGMTVACTNPAALGQKGSAPLDSYWFAPMPAQPGADPIVWSSEGAPPAPFLRTEGLVRGACVQRDHVGYLSVITDADPVDARTDRIPGDVHIGGRLQPGWGLHLADVNLALGDLIAAVETQARAYRAR